MLTTLPTSNHIGLLRVIPQVSPYLRLLLFQLWPEFQSGEKWEKHFLAWLNSYPRWSGLVKCIKTSQCLLRLQPQCAARGALHSSLLKIEIKMMVTNFRQWLASVRALLYPPRHSIDTVCLGVQFIAASIWWARLCFCFWLKSIHDMTVKILRLENVAQLLGC